MKLPGYIINKYTVSAIILLALLATDIALHKGMSRVMLPDLFTDKVVASDIRPAGNSLQTAHKTWTRGINSIALLNRMPPESGGFECDVYYDQATARYYVYHDSNHISRLTADSLFQSAKNQQRISGIWMDIKNLGPKNLEGALTEACRLRKQFGLEGKMIMESSDPASLQAFTDSGFYSSYYVPYFNPYTISEDSLVQMIGEIRDNLAKYPSSSLSGYYFQYPVFRKFFPEFPVLTWADASTLSVIGYFFRRSLENDGMVKVVLYPPVIH